MILAKIAETDTTTYNEALTGAAGGAIAGALLFFIVLAIVIQFISWAGMWKTASKAGQVGILACIPIVQVIIWLLIAKKPLWWILLFFVPLVNIVVIVIVMNGISNRFGRGVGTTLGLIFLPFIFWPILVFGDAEYQP